jgi:1-acyl-sn-glycerol-3-phosphate acyltransferase
MITKYARAARQWGPFAAKTAYYGAISCSFGPLTKDHRASQWAMREWCKSSVRGLEISVVVDGLENIPSDGAFVYAANHQSIVDIICLGSVLKHDYRWAAKRSLFKTPFLGWHLTLAGHVPVDRQKGGRSAAAVVDRFEAVLREGKPLLVFPEGTRTPDGGLQRFKNGGFSAAVSANVPVVPVALEGTFEMMKRGALDTGSISAAKKATRDGTADETGRTVRVRIGAPIAPKKDGTKSERVSDLRTRAFVATSELLVSIGGHVSERAKGAASAEPDDAEDQINARA